jgi:hypothetical protein
VWQETYCVTLQSFWLPNLGTHSFGEAQGLRTSESALHLCWLPRWCQRISLLDLRHMSSSLSIVCNLRKSLLAHPLIFLPPQWIQIVTQRIFLQLPLLAELIMRFHPPLHRVQIMRMRILLLHPLPCLAGIVRHLSL